MEGRRSPRDARRASSWIALNTALIRIVGIATTAIVARILTPEDFGTFALVLVVYGVLSGLTELGVGAAIARHDLDLESMAPTVTTISGGNERGSRGRNVSRC